jgi:hypothetical protein
MLQINELQMRIPGMNEEEGSKFGKLVAERLAAEIPDNYVDQQLPELKIQLSGALSKDTSALADRVADQIIRQIKLATL